MELTSLVDSISQEMHAASAQKKYRGNLTNTLIKRISDQAQHFLINFTTKTPRMLSE